MHANALSNYVMEQNYLLLSKNHGTAIGRNVIDCYISPYSYIRTDTFMSGKTWPVKILKEAPAQTSYVSEDDSLELTGLVLRALLANE